MLGDWLAGKPMSFVLTLASWATSSSAFSAAGRRCALAGRVDRKQTLSVLYNLVKEHKERDNN